jgi:hypothetical protein
MTNYHLSVEQRFHLEAAFREIDACEDIEKLRALTKQLITAQQNKKSLCSRGDVAAPERNGVCCLKKIRF